MQYNFQLFPLLPNSDSEGSPIHIHSVKFLNGFRDILFGLHISKGKALGTAHRVRNERHSFDLRCCAEYLLQTFGRDREGKVSYKQRVRTVTCPLTSATGTGAGGTRRSSILARLSAKTADTAFALTVRLARTIATSRARIFTAFPCCISAGVLPRFTATSALPALKATSSRASGNASST
jgi:hypothetical protein